MEFHRCIFNQKHRKPYHNKGSPNVFAAVGMAHGCHDCLHRLPVGCQYPSLESSAPQKIPDDCPIQLGHLWLDETSKELRGSVRNMLISWNLKHKISAFRFLLLYFKDTGKKGVKYKVEGGESWEWRFLPTSLFHPFSLCTPASFSL